MKAKPAAAESEALARIFADLIVGARMGFVETGSDCALFPTRWLTFEF